MDPEKYTFGIEAQQGEDIVIEWMGENVLLNKSARKTLRKVAEEAYVKAKDKGPAPRGILEEVWLQEHPKDEPNTFTAIPSIGRELRRDLRKRLRRHHGYTETKIDQIMLRGPRTIDEALAIARELDGERERVKESKMDNVPMSGAMLGSAICAGLGIPAQKVVRVVLDCTASGEAIVLVYEMLPSFDDPKQLFEVLRKYKVVPHDGENEVMEIDDDDGDGILVDDDLEYGDS